MKNEIDIQKLISEIIPPADYEHRNGFTNIHIIDQLTKYEKEQVEEVLISRLITDGDNFDDLIVETLAYLRSKKSLPILKNLLNKCSDDLLIIMIASSIFKIDQDKNMIDVAITAFQKIETIDHKNPYYIYIVTDAFSDLIKFNDPRVNKIIEGYISHPEYLISYNAKRALCKL